MIRPGRTDDSAGRAAALLAAASLARSGLRRPRGLRLRPLARAHGRGRGAGYGLHRRAGRCWRACCGRTGVLERLGSGDAAVELLPIGSRGPSRGADRDAARAGRRRAGTGGRGIVGRRDVLAVRVDTPLGQYGRLPSLNASRTCQPPSDRLRESIRVLRVDPERAAALGDEFPRRGPARCHRAGAGWALRLLCAVARSARTGPQSADPFDRTPAASAISSAVSPARIRSWNLLGSQGTLHFDFVLREP